jgi:hypothetical protein
LEQSFFDQCRRWRLTDVDMFVCYVPVVRHCSAVQQGSRMRPAGPSRSIEGTPGANLLRNRVTAGKKLLQALEQLGQEAKTKTNKKRNIN